MFWLGFFHLSESFFRGGLFLAIKSVSLPMKNPYKFGTINSSKTGQYNVHVPWKWWHRHQASQSFWCPFTPHNTSWCVKMAWESHHRLIPIFNPWQFYSIHRSAKWRKSFTISITWSWKQNPSWITTKSNDGKIWQIKVFPSKNNDLHRLRTQSHVSNKINRGFNAFNLVWDQLLLVIMHAGGMIKDKLIDKYRV